MTSTDTDAIQQAFIKGFEAGLKYRKTDRGIPQYTAVRANDSGIGSLIADPKLIGDRSISGVSSGLIASLVGAIVTGLIGAGVGSAIGMPAQGALAGAALGGAGAYSVGQAKGQLDADRRYLADKGYEASVPVPVKELALRPSISAVLPLSSYVKIKSRE